MSFQFTPAHQAEIDALNARAMEIAQVSSLENRGDTESILSALEAVIQEKGLREVIRGEYTIILEGETGAVCCWFDGQELGFDDQVNDGAEELAAA